MNQDLEFVIFKKGIKLLGTTIAKAKLHKKAT
jgi:hypothetical protein